MSRARYATLVTMGFGWNPDDYRQAMKEIGYDDWDGAEAWDKLFKYLLQWDYEPGMVRDSVDTHDSVVYYADGQPYLLYWNARTESCALYRILERAE